MFCYPSHTKVEPICKSTIRDKFQLHLRAIIPVSGKPSRIRSVGARKETYATTGSRIKLRFFGGWDFTEGDLSDNYAQAGYDKGVPMGGDLKAATADAPSFIVHAMMDPESGSLDRVQIIKGWVNADGSCRRKSVRCCLEWRSKNGCEW